MRVLSKIQSSLSELTFMHAGLITAAFLPARFIFYECRTNHKEAAALSLSLSRCAEQHVVRISLSLIICA
jgi:hypothetical protein